MRPLGAPLALLLCQVLGSWAACALLPAAGSGLQENPHRPSSPPATAPPGPGSRAAAALRGRGAPPAGPGGTCGAAGPGRRRARSSGAGLGAAGGPRWLPLNGSGRGGEGGAGGRGNGTGRRARLRNPFYPLTEESYGAYAVMCLSVVIFGIGIMGNMAVMCIVCHNYYMRSISNSLLANLAFWDFLIVFFCLPLVIFQELTKKWLLEDFSCKIVPYIEVMAVGGCAWAWLPLRSPPGTLFCASLIAPCPVWVSPALLVESPTGTLPASGRLGSSSTRLPTASNREHLALPLMRVLLKFHSSQSSQKAKNPLKI